MSSGSEQEERADLGTPGDPAVARRPTSADVAKRAGVSRTQVSYVLNKTGETHVSAEKRERILEATAALGYQALQSAQALRKGYSNEFSIFFPAPYPPRINDMIGSIHEAGLAMDCMPIQYSFNSYRDDTRKLETFRALLARRPVGLFCSLLDLGMEHVELARSKGVRRILVLDVEDHEDVLTLRLPTERIGYLVAEHLLGMGHRRLAIIRPSDPIQVRPFLSRLKGMEAAIRQSGDAQLAILNWPTEDLRPTIGYARNFVRDCLLPSLKLDRDSPERPTALYAYSDDYAFPVLAALREAGVEVPRDLSLIGTDDHWQGALWRPALSTVRFDSADLGTRAVSMINALITGAEIGRQVSVPLEPVLVPRDTVIPPGGAPAGRDGRGGLL